MRSSCGRSRAAALAAGLVLGGCGRSANLDAIARFGALANDAQKTSTAMATALYRECLVAREYGGVENLGAAPGAVAPPLQSDPVVGVVPPMPTPAPDPSATGEPRVFENVSAPAPARGDRPCAHDLETSQRWQAFNDGIFAYVEGLGDVAGVAVAPSADAYRKLGEHLHAVGLLRSDAVADAAGTFVADIGKALLERERDRDLRDLVDRSNRDGVFATMTDASQTADLGYYGAILADKSIVDAYFESSIAAQRLNIVRLLRADGDAPGRGEGSLERTCAGNCAHHVALAAHVYELRDRIATARARWAAIDLRMLADLGRVQPFYAAMGDLGRANGALIDARGLGLMGFANAVEPYLAPLQDDVSALVTADAATPSPESHSSPAAHATPGKKT